MPPTNGRIGCTPSASANGMSWPMSVQVLRTIPTCWFGAIIPAMRLPSTTMIRAIDHDRHDLSGVSQQMIPNVLRYRPPSPSWRSGAGSSPRSNCSPVWMFSLHGPVSTILGGIIGFPRAAAKVSTMSRPLAVDGSPTAIAIRASHCPGFDEIPPGAPNTRKPSLPRIFSNNGAA